MNGIRSWWQFSLQNRKENYHHDHIPFTLLGKKFRMPPSHDIALSGTGLVTLALAVWEAGISRHNGAQLRAPLEPLNVIVLWCIARDFRGASIGTLWSRETLVSRTELCIFSRSGPEINRAEKQLNSSRLRILFFVKFFVRLLTRYPWLHSGWDYMDLLSLMIW